ncbi:MAG: S24/S26 family peptidase [Bdellovibrionota bacterium]
MVEKLRKDISSGPTAFTVVTGSMEPLIATGSRIVVEAVSGPLEVFEIVLFWDGQSTLICHYILHANAIRGPGGIRSYVTHSLRGGEDLPIPENQILGRVTNHRLSRATRWRIVLARIFARMRRGLISG